MLSLHSVHLDRERTQAVPLAALGESHGLSETSARMYQRFFGLVSVSRCSDDLWVMLGHVLTAALDTVPGLRAGPGALVYCKTQTHNTKSDRHALRRFADQHGLPRWHAYSVHMTSCASALVHLHFANAAQALRPMILLTGEKAFHASVSRLSVGVLAEVPAAALFNAGPGTWRVLGTRTRHLARFYANPDAMDAVDRRALQDVYTEELVRFVADGLRALAEHLRPEFVFLPHNLNQPVTRELVRRFAWEARTFQGEIACQGHGYCSDMFANLSRFERSGGAVEGTQVLVLAAGTGVTFALCLIERLSA